MQWRRSVVKYGARDQSAQAIKLFQAPRKISFTFRFWHKSFILDDVKLTELSNNSFEWRNVTFLWESKHTLTPHTYFQGSRPPNRPGSERMFSFVLITCSKFGRGCIFILSICLSVCPRVNFKSCGRILMNFTGVGYVTSTSRWLDFGDDPGHWSCRRTPMNCLRVGRLTAVTNHSILLVIRIRIREFWPLRPLTFTDFATVCPRPYWYLGLEIFKENTLHFNLFVGTL